MEKTKSGEIQKTGKNGEDKMKAKNKIYGHIETVHVEIPEEIKNLPQSVKWLYAACDAPVWKKDEYVAQSLAWEKHEVWIFDGISPLARM
ncbi:MAG: hypothetical protein WC878_03135 [Candidatus Paceibacterota bacterium]